MKKSFLLCLFIFGLLALVPNVSASGEGWLDGWDYRQGITITGSSGAGTNYQVKLDVTYDANMQADFDDLRFTDASGITELDYWIESYVASTSAVVWVEIADNLNVTQEGYMYFGNDAVSTTSDGDDTFLFFDDFATLDAAKWSWSGAVVSGGELVLEPNEWIKSDDLFNSSTALETRSNQSLNSKHNLGFASDWPAAGAMWIQHNSLGNAYMFEGHTDTGTLLYPDGVYCIQSLYWKDVDEGAYDINRAAIEHRDDTDIPDSDMYIGISLWGTSDTDFFADWLFLRNWIESEPIASFGIWNELEPAILYFSVLFDYWALNMGLVFGGLIIMLVSVCMMAVKVRDRTITRDAGILLLFLFCVGWGLFIGGTIIG